MAGHGVLGRHCRRHGVGGTLERHEEPITRRVDLVPVLRLERLAQQAPVHR
jgi:hypothetical protein